MKRLLMLQALDDITFIVFTWAETNISSTRLPGALYPATWYLGVPELTDCKYSDSIAGHFCFSTSLISTEPIQVTGCQRVMVLIHSSRHCFISTKVIKQPPVACSCFNNNQQSTRCRYIIRLIPKTIGNRKRDCA